MNKSFVAVLMGSENDLPILEKTFEVLNELQVCFEGHVLSAHRTPEDTVSYVKNALQKGCAVFIAAAGLAAHLAGTIAAHTIKPVIGIPLDSGSLKGWDALLSTVQMPGGIPVACTAIGAAGAKNAALLAAQILAIQDEALSERLLQYRQKARQNLRLADEKLQEKLLHYCSSYAD